MELQPQLGLRPQQPLRVRIGGRSGAPARRVHSSRLLSSRSLTATTLSRSIKTQQPKETIKNAMCPGTLQRQSAEGDPSHRFHSFTMPRLHCWARWQGWTSVFAGATRVGSPFRSSTAQFVIATLQRGCLWDSIAFVPTARPPP